MRLVAPCSVTLDEARASDLDAFLWEQRAEVDAIREDIHSKVATRSLDAGGDVDARSLELLLRFRRWRARRGWSLASRVIDDAVRSTRPEIMDMPWIPAWVRRLEMSTLDRVTGALGSYDAWARAVDRAAGPEHGQRLWDLAAGLGGFFRHLARSGLARDRGWSLVATDIEPTYVALGEQACMREGLQERVRCERRSAVELEALRGQVELFVCTQALHHWPPGFIVRVIAGAIRVAPRGILMIDLARGALLAAGTGVVLSAVARVPFVVFDGVRSVRRAYLPSELSLLARLAGSANVDARWDPPAHHFVHARIG
jgi:2-polyprenyl-3-methyl-5-hydroxy-6-metoxy-1,4-benzoquinol methylase